MSKKKIVFDFDNTITSSTEQICNIYAKKYNHKVDYTKVKRWDFMDVLTKSTPEEINSWFSSEEFFNNLNPIDGMIELIHELNRRMDVDIYICTCHRAESIHLKDKWIRDNFNFDVNVYYVALTGDEVIKKDLIVCDAFIDDSISALDSVNAKVKICFGDYGWNNTDKYIKVKDARELREELNKILN